jgi:CRISPR system Cascade subunit CasC
MNGRLFLDVHVIQTVPPSCVNRDDTGSPKTCVYGGVRRARVSSQSWKHAVRNYFAEEFKGQDLGIRTKRVIEMIATRIEELSPGTSDPTGSATAVLEAAGIKAKGKKEGELGALMFVSRTQIDSLAKLAISGKYDKKEVKEALGTGFAVDIALFGRMVADDPSLNSDACCQVAHAISTHRVSNEYDYYTARDDLSKDDEAGAGMIGTIEFNSSTLYRYSTVAVHELQHIMNDDSAIAAHAVAEYVKAFCLSMPTGKINTFANRTVPDAVLVIARNDQPVSLSGAFETPVTADSQSGYVLRSVARMVDYNKSICSDFLPKPIRTWQIGAGLEAVGPGSSLQSAISEIEEFIRGRE